MNDHRLLAPYGLKFNPFSPQVPVEALRPDARIESFCLRLSHQVREGGFAQVIGRPGTGKSACLRLLARRLAESPDVAVGVLTRPQCSVPDLYRELGHLFVVQFNPHNRWAAAKTLRERWQAHIEAALFRPVLLIDEAQEMQASSLNELRLLASKDLDSCSLITVVLCGDDRLATKLLLPELQPVASRIRNRLRMDDPPGDHVRALLRHLLQAAGNANLMTAELMDAVCEHAAGNVRTLMNLGNELLQAGLERQGCPLDEKLFFEVFAASLAPARRPGRAR